MTSLTISRTPSGSPTPTPSSSPLMPQSYSNLVLAQGSFTSLTFPFVSPGCILNVTVKNTKLEVNPNALIPLLYFGQGAQCATYAPLSPEPLQSFSVSSLDEVVSNSITYCYLSPCCMALQCPVSSGPSTNSLTLVACGISFSVLPNATSQGPPPTPPKKSPFLSRAMEERYFLFFLFTLCCGIWCMCERRRERAAREKREAALKEAKVKRGIRRMRHIGPLSGGGDGADSNADGEQQQQGGGEVGLPLPPSEHPALERSQPSKYFIPGLLFSSSSPGWSHITPSSSSSSSNTSSTTTTTNTTGVTTINPAAFHGVSQPMAHWEYVQDSHGHHFWENHVTKQVMWTHPSEETRSSNDQLGVVPSEAAAAAATQ